MNFALAGFIDTFELVSSLRTRMGMFKLDPEAEQHCATIDVRVLRDEDGGHAYRASVTQKWPELRAALAQLQRMGNARLGECELGCIWLELLSPGTTLPWSSEPGEWGVLRVALRTNPGAMVFSGTEGQRLLPGDVVVVNVAVPCSAVNLGEWPVVHLVCEFRAKNIGRMSGGNERVATD